MYAADRIEVKSEDWLSAGRSGPIRGSPVGDAVPAISS